MNPINSNRIMLLLSIVERGKGAKLIETLRNYHIRINIQSVGFGTAPTEMMDIFGLGTKDKDIIISMAVESAVRRLMADYENNFSRYSEYGGLIIILPLSAMNRLTAEITRHDLPEEIAKGADIKMKSEHKHNLVTITVAQGYANDVMHTARRAGATGGTVLRGRLADPELFKELANLDMDEEREIILIMAPASITDHLMAELNRTCGLKTEAHGMLCAVPIETAYKI